VARARRKPVRPGVKELDEIKRGVIACILGNEVP